MSESRISLLRAIDKISDAEYKLTGVTRLLVALTESSSVVSSEELDVLAIITENLRDQLGEARETWEKAFESTRAETAATIKEPAV